MVGCGWTTWYITQMDREPIKGKSICHWGFWYKQTSSRLDSMVSKTFYHAIWQRVEAEHRFLKFQDGCSIDHITVTLHERHDVDCSFNSSSRLILKISKHPHHWHFVMNRIHQWPVDSSHKWSSNAKTLQCHYGILADQQRCYIKSH